MTQFFQVLLLMLLTIKTRRLTKKSGNNLRQHFVVFGAKPTKQFFLNVVFNVEIIIRSSSPLMADGL